MHDDDEDAPDALDDRRRRHDLMGTINAMSLAVQILASGRTNGRHDTLEWLDVIIDAADRAVGILDGK